MSISTSLSSRNLVIYSIYVRNHGPNGTFADVEKDLPRIRSMGVDVVWLMPIHPIGVKKRKGGLGCPYSIADYREVNPEYGTKDDFARLVKAAHELGLKVMIDVVYNHTAADAVYLESHPDWYHLDQDGNPCTTVPEWSDIIDLNHDAAAAGDNGLWRYLIESLVYWVKFGVDGFRCDVASLVPVRFWTQAVEAVAAARPGIIWLAESVHPHFIAQRRHLRQRAHSDGELYAAFDITYSYDVASAMQHTMAGRSPVEEYANLLALQDAIYPANYCKLRFVENHDQPRVMAIASGEAQALAWTAFECFNKGAFLIYAGQEAGADRTPSLFDRDPVQWDHYHLQPFLSRLCKLKKDPVQMEGQFIMIEHTPALQAAWQSSCGSLYGIFNVTATSEAVAVQLPDGEYADLLGDVAVAVTDGFVKAPHTAFVLRCNENLSLKPYIPDRWEFKLETCSTV